MVAEIVLQGREILENDYKNALEMKAIISLNDIVSKIMRNFSDY